MTEEKKPVAGLALLREQFPENQISKLPKPTKRQTDDVRADFKKGVRCDVCGGWHHPNVVHLDYVGHAALTDRLLDCDPEWNWEPTAFSDVGAPVFDGNGGMWIKLTVCGMTRLGYGSADGKKGGDAVKEIIGDALRNAAMRFGAALDLWHKGDLHAEEDEPDQPQEISPEQFIQLRDKVEEWGGDQAKFIGAYGAQSLEQFPVAALQKALAALDKRIAEKPDESIDDDKKFLEGN